MSETNSVSKKPPKVPVNPQAAQAVKKSALQLSEELDAFCERISNTFSLLDRSGAGYVSFDLLMQWMQLQPCWQELEEIATTTFITKQKIFLFDFLSFCIRTRDAWDANDSVVAQFGPSLNAEGLLDRFHVSAMERGAFFSCCFTKPESLNQGLAGEEVKLEWRRIFLWLNPMKTSAARKGSFYWTFEEQPRTEPIKEQSIPFHRVKEVCAGRTNNVLCRVDLSISSNRCFAICGNLASHTLNLIADPDSTAADEWIKDMRQRLGSSLRNTFFHGSLSLSSNLAAGRLATFVNDEAQKAPCVVWVDRDRFFCWSDPPEFGQPLVQNEDNMLPLAAVSRIVTGYNEQYTPFVAKESALISFSFFYGSRVVTFEMPSYEERTSFLFGVNKCLTLLNKTTVKRTTVATKVVQLTSGGAEENPLVRGMINGAAFDRYMWNPNMLWMVSTTAKFSKLIIREMPSGESKEVGHLNRGDVLIGIRIWHNWIQHDRGWNRIFVQSPRFTGVAIAPVDTNLHEVCQHRFWKVLPGQGFAQVRVRQGPAQMCDVLSHLSVDDVVEGLEIYNGWLHHSYGWSMMKDNERTFFAPLTVDELAAFEQRSDMQALYQCTWKSAFSRVKIRTKPHPEAPEAGTFIYKGNILPIYDEQKTVSDNPKFAGTSFLQTSAGWVRASLGENKLFVKVTPELINSYEQVPPFWEIIFSNLFSRLRCRNGPSFTSTTTGFLSRGTIVRAYGKVGSWLHHNRGWSCLDLDVSSTTQTMAPFMLVQNTETWIKRERIFLFYAPRDYKFGALYWNNISADDSDNTVDDANRFVKSEQRCLPLHHSRDLILGVDTMLFATANQEDVPYLCVDDRCMTLVSMPADVLQLEALSDAVAHNWKVGMAYLLKGSLLSLKNHASGELTERLYRTEMKRNLSTEHMRKVSSGNHLFAPTSRRNSSTISTSPSVSGIDIDGVRRYRSVTSQRSLSGAVYSNENSTNSRSTSSLQNSPYLASDGVFFNTDLIVTTSSKPVIFGGSRADTPSSKP